METQKNGPFLRPKNVFGWYFFISRSSDTIEMKTMFCSRFNLISPPTLTHNVQRTALLKPSWEPDFVLTPISEERPTIHMNIEVKGSGVVGLTDCNAFEAEY